MHKQRNITGDWRTDTTLKIPDKLKIADKEEVKVTMLGEGDYYFNGESIGFEVRKDGEADNKIFYVNSDNFSFLNDIKKLGTLTGLKVKITRKGSTKSDTRYSIEKI